MVKAKEPYYEGEDKMNWPTLYDLLRMVNFRYYDSDATHETLKHNTNTIRIYLTHCAEDWIEFGIYDFGSDINKEKLIKCTFNPEILSQKVNSFYVDDYLNILCVHVEELNG